MEWYQQGSTGPEVKKIQIQLKELGYYFGPIDGIYGDGTESAVKAFQRANELLVDGIVGPNTWQELFDEEKIAEPAISDMPLSYRCLALTGSFETGTRPAACFTALSGDDDGQGISFGCLQWNLGQQTLQPMLEIMNNRHENIMKEVFDGGYADIQEMLNSPYEEQMEWASSIQDLGGSALKKPWGEFFKSLGQREAFQNIQVEAASELYEAAVTLAGEYDLSSERAVALMFDIQVQNGSISDSTENKIREDIKNLPTWEEGEVARLGIIANRRSEAAKPQWIEDVRTRKLTIATGRGTVHGIHYVLDKEYGIRLNKTEL